MPCKNCSHRQPFLYWWDFWGPQFCCRLVPNNCMIHLLCNTYTKSCVYELSFFIQVWFHRFKFILVNLNFGFFHFVCCHILTLTEMDFDFADKAFESGYDVYFHRRIVIQCFFFLCVKVLVMIHKICLREVQLATEENDLMKFRRVSTVQEKCHWSYRWKYEDSAN